jgi:Peptidase A4 family/Beta-lactamase
MRVLTIAALTTVLGSFAFVSCAQAQNSSTWSGYLVENGGSQAISYTAAAVSFGLPDVSCPNTGLGSAAGVSFWVGLDHGGTSPIEKAGIMVTCDKTQTPTYQAFWLMYVPGQTADVHLGFTAKPGDSIRAAVTYANGAFQLSVADASVAGHSLSSGPQSCAATSGCPRASVEWMVERPGDDIPLAAYGCVPAVCSNQAPAPPGIILNDPVMFTPGATYSGPNQGTLHVLGMHEIAASGAADGPPISYCLAAPINQPITRGTEARESGAVHTTLSGSFLCQWSGYGIAACDPSGCMSEQTFCQNIVNNFYNQQTNQLFVSGYTVLCGAQQPYAGGLSRADLNINVASVTKTMTAILILNEIAAHKTVTIDDSIWKYLPAPWQATISQTQQAALQRITLKDLLEQKSGLCASYSTGQPTPTACANAPSLPLCGGDDTMDSVLLTVLQSAVDPKPSWHYDNCNFALFRALLPQITGNSSIYSSPNSARNAANLYISEAYKYVFSPLNLPMIDCKPTAPSMLGWPFPPTGNGWNGGTPWEVHSPNGDWTLSCGGGGLNMSAQDFFAVLNDLANGAVLLTSAQKAEMKADFLGWDNYLRPSGPPDGCPGYVCKNGNIPAGIPAYPTQIWTYAGIIKCTVPVAIIVNSPLPPYYQPYPSVPAPPNAQGTDIIGLVNDALTAAPKILAPRACPAGSFH